jgi:parallel beta-helix repeat protein
MIRSAALLPLLAAAPLAAQDGSEPVAWAPGMVITRSTTIRPGTWQAPAGDSAAIVVRGDGIVLDLTGVELVGSGDRQRPDRFTGAAIRIEGGRGVTVRGARIRGYKVGVLARGTQDLRLLDNDFSHNWRPRLYSGIERESLADWLSYHHNENDEWLRYGAAMYLDGVRGGEVRGNTVRQGMNGLLLTQADGLRVWNNDISFNSGIGIGLYRSSGNLIAHNRVDWNVRGYSHGFFNRGQDSAALLVYEQSSRNIVAHNSMTHSGDGLFLWAGQSTMDTGAGGANDNLFYANDFSFAPTNGMEATFSRNAFVGNRIEGSWHGLWGGYSWESVIMGNTFVRNVDGVAIEHGQDNRIVGNRFEGDTTAIHLWWNRLEPSDWGYPKHRDTRSRDYAIEGNHFLGVRTALRAKDTQRLLLARNTAAGVDTLVVAEGDTSEWSGGPIRTVRRTPDRAAGARAPAMSKLSIPERYRVQPLEGGRTDFARPERAGGRETIIVDEWGPYDWKSPKLWPAGRSDTIPVALRVLGPAGEWRVVGRDGIASISRSSGPTGETIVVTPAAGRGSDFSIELEYRGAATVSRFGESSAAGVPVRFGWNRFVPDAVWHVTFAAIDSATIVPPAGLPPAAAPTVAIDTSRLDLMWYRPPRAGIPQSRVLTEATARVRLAPGRYRLRTIADDAMRVYVDGRVVLEDWTPGESRAKEVVVELGGEHAFRVKHLQLDGWYELRLDIEREGME